MPAGKPGEEPSTLKFLDNGGRRSIRNVEKYDIIDGIAGVSILYDEGNMEHIYFVREPSISIQETITIRRISLEIERMIPLLVDGHDPGNYDDLEVLIDEYMQLHHPEYGRELVQKLKYTVRRMYEGFGKMHVIALDPNVEDISCNGPGTPVFVYHRKYGSLKSNISFSNEAELSSTIVKLAQICGKEVSVSSPILDGITLQGHRIQGIYGNEISPKGSALTVRLFREKPFTPVDLINSGAASPEMMAYFWYMVEYLGSALIVGPPAVGKTSTLNSIMMLVPPNTKVFSIEETREINLLHENWVAASTRETSSTSAKVAGTEGKVDLFDLVKMAMRQRPTYLVVGEVRGKEAYTLFQAMSTGHTTYSTMHADSMSTLLNRLESEPLNVPRLLISSLGTVVISHFIRKGQLSLRRITEVNEVVGIDNRTNELVYNRVFSYDSNDDVHTFSGQSMLLERISRARNISSREFFDEFRERAEHIREMCQSEENDYKSVWEKINDY